MKHRPAPKYVVLGMTGADQYPVADSRFQIQVLNSIGEGELIAYFDRSSSEPLAVIHATSGPMDSSHAVIPNAIIEAARRRAGVPGH